jgi:hypothetical protein
MPLGDVKVCVWCGMSATVITDHFLNFNFTLIKNILTLFFEHLNDCERTYTFSEQDIT